MARANLTDRKVQTARAPQAGRIELFDTVRPGLCFRITEKGVKSWSLMYRFNGDLRRDTLGTYPRIGLAKARQLARDSLELVGQGIDPREQEAAQKAAAAERKADTVSVVVDRFVKQYAIQRRWDDLERILRREAVTAWGGRPVSEITKRDAMTLLDGIAERAPVRANRVLTVLRVFFKWCKSRDLIESSPVVEIEEPTEEFKRERELTDSELIAVWRAAETLGWPFGRIFQLLLLTACRRDEIGGAHWSELTDDATLEIPSKRYKTKRPHVAPLSKMAVDIIAGLPRQADCDLVFTTTGKTPVSGYSRAKIDLDKLMLAELRKIAKERGEDPDGVKLVQWQLRDLRRTARTGMSKLGVSPDIGEMVLGHAIGGVREVYDRYEYLPQKRHAIERWADHVSDLLNPPKKDGKVAQFRRGK